MEGITIEELVKSCTECKHLGQCEKGKYTGTDCLTEWLEDEVINKKREDFIEKVIMENEYGDFTNGVWHNY